MSKNLDKPILSWSRITILILNYFVGYMFIYPLLVSWITLQFHLNAGLYDLLCFSIYLFMILISIIAGYPVLKEGLQNLPRFNKFIENTLIIFVILYFVSGLTSAFVSLISGLDQSVNQQTVISAFYESPLLIIFTTLIYAPIVEEMVFRGAIFRGLRSHFNFWIAAIISALAFGGIHVIESLISGNFIDLLYLLTYGSLGFIFCYSYEKNDSIYGSIVLHFMNNFIGIIGIIISVFAG